MASTPYTIIRLGNETTVLDATGATVEQFDTIEEYDTYFSLNESSFDMIYKPLAINVLHGDIIPLDYENDAAAAGGGIAIGGLYHSDGTIKIRLT